MKEKILKNNYKSILGYVKPKLKYKRLKGKLLMLLINLSNLYSLIYTLQLQIGKW